MATGCLPILDIFTPQGFAGCCGQIAALLGVLYLLFGVPHAAKKQTPNTKHELPHRTQNLAADLVPLRFAVGHHALARGEDGNAEAIEDTLHFLVALVNAAAGLRVALDMADDPLPIRAILQKDLK